MAETIRYTRIAQEDINFGVGTFEVRLADGRVVVLSQGDLGDILSDASLSTRTVTLDSLTVATLTVNTSLLVTDTFRLPEKADPGSPVSGELWINSGGTFPEYADDAATPAKHAFVGDDTTQTLTNKTLTDPSLNTSDLTAIDELAFSNAAANASAAGRLRRNANELTWHNGTSALRVFFGESGTLMLFQQTTAPTGWTKQTTHDNKVLRVVSGTASSGGSSSFSTIFNSGTSLTTNNHTVTTGEMPSHAHTQQVVFAGDGTSGSVGANASNNVSVGTTDSAGGGGAHNHTLTMDLAFVDLILASKD